MKRIEWIFRLIAFALFIAASLPASAFATRTESWRTSALSQTTIQENTNQQNKQPSESTTKKTNPNNVISDTLSAISAHPVSEPQEYSANNQGNQQYNWYDTFLVHPTEWLLSLFNGLLVLYTARLWTATNGLRESAEKTAKQQLRAYVVIDKSEIARLVEPPNTLLVHIIMKNCGQTPASDASCNIDILMNEKDKIIYDPSKVVPKEQRESVAIIGPQGTYEIKKRLTLTKEGEFEKFNEGKFIIQITARIDYKDIFEEDQHYTSTLISGDFFPSNETGLHKSLGYWALSPQKSGVKET